MALTKHDIIKKVTDRLGSSRNESVELAEILVEAIKASLEQDGQLMISGFGKFTVKQKAERKGHNPATGQSMMLPKRKVVTFQHSTSLKDKMNK